MRLAAGALVLALQACAQPAAPPPPQRPAAPEGQCNSAGAEFAIGHVAGEALSSQAATRAGASRVRVLRPGQMVTQEFDASRLNLEVDASGRVVRVRCG
jgi:hypothetical protein